MEPLGDEANILPLMPETNQHKPVHSLAERMAKPEAVNFEVKAGKTEAVQLSSSESMVAMNTTVAHKLALFSRMQWRRF